MRLTKLNPKWIAPNNFPKDAKFYTGVSFLCPHCELGPCPHCSKDMGHRLVVMFWPPIDPDNVAASFLIPIPDNKGHRRASGETFDTLTLLPSIGFDTPPHFHGDITNGEITNQYKNAKWTEG